MSELIKIAVDAMGGDGSPKKVIEGLILNHKKNRENYFKIFGNQDEIINLIVGVMGYSAEMELTNIRRRTAEGRAVAKSRGVKFGMKRKYNQHQIAEIMRKREEGEGYGTIGRALGMSRSTVATIVKREKTEMVIL